MIYFLIGHRGTGKTSLLDRLRQYYGDRIRCFDLDQEIEKATSLSISQIFQERGESVFREFEKKVFQETLMDSDKVSSSRDSITVMSLGGGFDLNLLNAVKEKEILWVRRETDSEGRIFLDRPRLDPRTSPLEEYRKIYGRRQDLYSRYSTLPVFIPEGWIFPNAGENLFFEALFFGVKNKKHKENENTYATLFPSLISHASVFINLGMKLELRTDVLAWETIKELVRSVPCQDLLLSIRNIGFLEHLPRLPKDLKVDWAYELGVPPEVLREPGALCSISFHERENLAVLDSIQKFFEYKSTFWPRCDLVLKFSPVIENFKELSDAYEYFRNQDRVDFGKIAFLPRGTAEKKGSFRWFRLVTELSSPLTFIHSGDDSQLDLPLLLDWLRANPSSEFGAVIGNPVKHSLTPAFHSEFSARELGNAPFYPIQVSVSEKREAIKLLARLGLRYVAVTSPLKENGVNTLFLTPDGESVECNTDEMGLRALLKKASDTSPLGPTYVWGGGGVLPTLSSVLPEFSDEIHYYSVRTGQERETKEVSAEYCPVETVIWAGAPGLDRFPDPAWRPNRVVDLSYQESSRGREYALRSGARYVSGLEMFRAQALAQQKFWKTEFKKKEVQAYGS